MALKFFETSTAFSFCTFCEKKEEKYEKKKKVVYKEKKQLTVKVVVSYYAA